MKIEDIKVGQFLRTKVLMHDKHRPETEDIPKGTLIRVDAVYSSFPGIKCMYNGKLVIIANKRLEDLEPAE